MITKLFKNSAYLLSSQLAVKVLAFFYTIFLARNLGVENYGLYIVAISYFSLVSFLTDMGVSNLFIREVSRNQMIASLFLPNVLLLRLISIAAAFAFIAGLFILNNLNANVAYLNLLAIAIVLPQTIGLVLDSFFTAIQKFYYPALNLIILNVFSIVCGIILVIAGYGPLGALLGMMAGHLVYAITAMFFLKLQKFNIRIKLDLLLIKRILKESLPYGILFTLGYFYYKIDILILSYIQGSYATGIYGAAYKFLEAVIFVPSAFLGVLFPYMSKISDKDPKLIYNIYLKSTITFLGVSLLIVLFYLTVLPLVIQNLLPDYFPSIKVIKILALSIPFFFMISPQAALLTSQKKFLKPLILISIFNLFLNVLFNLLFIPKYSYFAAAWITVISDIIGFVIFFIFISIKMLRK